MDIYEATELAYKNGYIDGQRDMACKNESIEAKYKRLQEDYEILCKMYAKVNEDLCVRTKERDAAVQDLKNNNKCRICKHRKENIQDCQHYSSCGLAYIHFEWRGIDGNT